LRIVAASSQDIRSGVGCLVEAPACGSYFERGTRISFAPLQRRDRDVAPRGALFLIVDKNAVAADRVFPDAQVPMLVRFRQSEAGVIDIGVRRWSAAKEYAESNSMN
jgi:hypothetical protein